MKLRQKLAVVLASAMAVTAVPVVTMAASTNSLTKEALKVKKDCEFAEIATANGLRVKFTSTTGNKVVFYLELDNAEWNEDTFKAAAAFSGNSGKMEYDEVAKAGTFTVEGEIDKISFVRQSDKILEVTVPASIAKDDKVIVVPIVAKAKDGDAKVGVKAGYGTGDVSVINYVFATSADKTVSITVGDAKTFYTSGELAEIIISEVYDEALEKADEKNRTITLELDDPDFCFTGDKATLEGSFGFSGKQEVAVNVDKDDDGKATIILPNTNSSTRGEYKLTGIKVKSTNKKPVTGDFLVDIKGDGLSAEKTNTKMAVISEYGTYLKMNDDKAVDIKGGRKAEIKFEIGENVENSMVSNRDIEITLDNAHFDYKGLLADAKTAGKLDSNSETADKKQAKYIDEEWLATKILDNAGDWKGCKAAFDVNSDGEIIPETIIFTTGTDKDGKQIQANTSSDKLKFKVNTCVPVGNKDKGKVTLKVSGRAIEDNAEVTAINIINPFNVTFEQAVLKTGLQGQVAGTVTIKETDKDMFQRGDVKFKITKDNEEFDIYLTDAKVEVSDGLKGTKTTVTKGKTSGAAIQLDLNRASKEAATITFNNLTFTTSRTVPEGTYDLELSGTALDADGHNIKIKDFIKISTANTEKITANGLAKGTASFVIGESKYVLNGKEAVMDAPSYIQDPGYTMVPVRYVAQAFGVSEADILFGKGTVTIFAGERTISLTTGSNIAVVNGNSVAMTTAVVNKDGRTYVPAGQIASLLGIKSTWDAASKTATFDNN